MTASPSQETDSLQERVRRVRIALEKLVEGWTTINGTHVLVGDDDDEVNLDYTVSPNDIQSGEPTTEQLDTFNKEFKENYSNATELYRGVGSERAIRDALENNVVRNTRGTPVSFSINPKVAQDFAFQKEPPYGAVMVFDKNALSKDITVPNYEKFQSDPNIEPNLLDRLPSTWAFQEEVRGVGIKLEKGTFKELRVQSMEAVKHYRELFGNSIQIKLVSSKEPSKPKEAMD